MSSRPPPPPPPMGPTGIGAGSSSSGAGKAGITATTTTTNDPFAAAVMSAMSKQGRPTGGVAPVTNARPISIGTLTPQQQRTPPPPQSTPPHPPSQGASSIPHGPPKAQPQPRAFVGGVPHFGGVIPTQAFLQRQLLFGAINPQQAKIQQQHLQMIHSIQLQQLALQQQQHTQNAVALAAAAALQQQNGRAAPPPPAPTSAAAAVAAANLAAAQRGITVTGSPFVGSVGTLGQMPGIGGQSRVPGMAGLARMGKGIMAISQVPGGVSATGATSYLTNSTPGNPPPPPSTTLLANSAVPKPTSTGISADLTQIVAGGNFRAIPALPTPFQNHSPSSCTNSQGQPTTSTTVSSQSFDSSRPRIFGTTSSPLPRPPIVGSTITRRTASSQSAQGAPTPSVSSPNLHKQSNSVQHRAGRSVGAVSAKAHVHNTRTHPHSNFSSQNKFTAPAQARANAAASKLVELRNEQYKPNGIDAKLTEFFSIDFKSADQLTFDTDLLQKRQQTEREQLCAIQFANQQRLHNQLLVDGYERYLPAKPDIIDWRIEDKIQEGVAGSQQANGSTSITKDGSRKRTKSTKDVDGDTDMMNSDDNPSASKRAKIVGITASGPSSSGGPIVGAPIVGAVPISHSQVAQALTRDKPLANGPDFSRRALNPKDDDAVDENKMNGMNRMSRRKSRGALGHSGMNGHIDGAVGMNTRPGSPLNGVTPDGTETVPSSVAPGSPSSPSSTNDGDSILPQSPDQPKATDPGILSDTMKDDDWNPCDVCGSYNSVSGDLMVYCDGCEVSVHQWCYGIQTIPEDSWYCDACEAQRENPSNIPRLACCLCPVRDGKPHAFKHSSDGRWVHMVCALYIPEIIFQDRMQFRDPTITSVLKTRKRLKCIVCGTRNGACLQCAHKHCSKSFHPMCARQKGIMMGLIKKGGGVHTTVAWCPRHADSSALKNDKGKKKNNALNGTPNGKSSGTRRRKKREWSPPPARKTNYTTEYFFTNNLSVFPCNEEYKCAADYSLADQVPDSPSDTNRWEIISTTDTRSRLAFDAHNIISNAWDESITGSADMNNERRISRKAIGYSVLKNPSGDILVCANWNIWEVNCKIACMVIKFMVTAKRNSAHVSQRRRKSGTLLASHLMDLALSKKKVEWILVCSEPGYPERFWASLGFKPMTRRDRQKFSVVSESELNPFRDTVLMMITKDQLFEKVGFSATAYAWAFWHEKHKNSTHKLSFKEDGTVFHEAEMPMF